jgi:hypothetical protein
MCPANGEMENGDRESPVEFLCHIAHLRAAVLNLNVPEHGDCEFCIGGIRHDEVMDAARRVANNEIDVEISTATEQLLPILNNLGPTVAGCGSCGRSV